MECLKCQGLLEYNQEKTESNQSFEYFRCVLCGDRIYNPDPDAGKLHKGKRVKWEFTL